jgi:hypothetical protein
VFVAVDDERGVVGFYSLSSFTLALDDLPEEIARKLPRYDAIPAALIGRLARDQQVRGAGIGDLLLADAVDASWAQAVPSPCSQSSLTPKTIMPSLSTRTSASDDFPHGLAGSSF